MTPNTSKIIAILGFTEIKIVLQMMPPKITEKTFRRMGGDICKSYI